MLIDVGAKRYTFFLMFNVFCFVFFLKRNRMFNLSVRLFGFEVSGLVLVIQQSIIEYAVDVLLNL